MIIWINGPYGVGKTTLAEELSKRNKKSFIFDAEAVGNAIRDNMPEEFFKDTFEEFPLWAETCRKLLKNLDAVYDGDIFVPMTLLLPESVFEIIEKLRNEGVKVCHIILEADEKTLFERIVARGEEEDCWCVQNIGRCFLAQKNMPFDLRINSMGKTPEEIAKEIGL